MRHPAAILIVVLLIPAGVRAHGDLDRRIAAVTAEIAKQPTDGNLRLKRGELYRLHREWEKGLAEYAEAARLLEGADVIDFCRGRLYYEWQKYEEALAAIRVYLGKKPGEPTAQVIEARVLRALGRHLEAARVYDAAIPKLKRVGPDVWLDRARALLAADREKYIDEALRGLDEGLEKLRHPVVLALEVIDLMVSLGRYDGAIAHLERIISRSQRKDTWIAQRAEIFEKAGRKREAAASWREALAHIERLPQRLRRLPRTKKHEQHVRERLAALGK